MPTYKEFEGINLITDPTKKIIGEVLLINELGGISNGYRIDNAGTPNSGFSFGGNQMDLSEGVGNQIFQQIIKQEVGQSFYDSISNRITQKGNSDILTQQEKSKINSALSSNYGKQLINQAFVDEVNSRSNHVDDLARLLNTSFTGDAKVALVDYDNQFGIGLNNTSSSSMRSKLQNVLNQNGKITLEDVENSIRSTGQYKDNKKSQEIRIQETRKIITDAGLVSDGSDSGTSLKNSLVTPLATITVTAQKEAAAKSWFETFSDSLSEWTGMKKFIRSIVATMILLVILLTPIRGYATTKDEAENNALEYALKLQGINTPYHKKLWTEMKQIREERDNSNFKGEKNLIKFLIKKYKLDPINNSKDQCDLMERMVGYFKPISRSNNFLQFTEDGYIKSYYIISESDYLGLLKYGELNEGEGGGDEFYIIFDNMQRPIGVWSSFYKPFSITQGFYKIGQGYREESYNNLNYLVPLKNLNKENNISYLKINNCYIKEIHLKLDSVYINPSYSKNLNN